MKLPDLLAADPATLPQLAADALKPAARTHWSMGAILLGRMTDAHVHPGANSTELWAREALDMAKGEFLLALKLWRLLQRGQASNPSVPYDAWAGLSKARALLVDEVAAAGGSIAEWLGKARGAKGLEAFEHEVDAQLEREPWTTLKYRVPTATVAVIKAGLKRVLPLALEGQTPASSDPNHPRYWLDLIDGTSTAHKVLEALAVHALQTLPEPEFTAAPEQMELT